MFLFVLFHIFSSDFFYSPRSRKPEKKHALQRINCHVSRLSLKAASSSLPESVLVRLSHLSFVALAVWFRGMKSVPPGDSIRRVMRGSLIM